MSAAAGRTAAAAPGRSGLPILNGWYAVAVSEALAPGTLERLHYIEVARASAVYALLCPDVGEGAHVGADGAHGRTTLA